MALDRIVRGTAGQDRYAVALRKRFGDQRCIFRCCGCIRREIFVQKEDVERAHSLAERAGGEFWLEQQGSVAATTEKARLIQRETSEMRREAISPACLASADRGLRTM